MKKAIICIITIITVLNFAFSNLAFEIHGEESEDKSSRVIRVAVIDSPNFIRINEFGETEGYVYQYLMDIAEYTGWTYEFYEMSLKDVAKAVENGEVDIAPGFRFSEELSGTCMYSEFSMGITNTVLCANSDDKRYIYNDFSNFDGMEIGVIAGTYISAPAYEFLDQQGVEYTVKEYDTDRQAKQALENHEVDSILMSTIRYEQKYKVIAEIDAFPIYFIVSSDEPEIKAQLDDAQKQMHIKDPYYEKSLDQLFYDKNKGPVTFTREELEYIENQDTIIVSCMSGRYPMGYQKTNGEMSGMYVDILDKISEMSGLEFEYVEAEAGVRAVDILKNTDARIYAGLMESAYSLISDELVLSDTIFLSSISIAGRRGELFDITGNFKIAVQSNYVSAEHCLRKMFPNAELVYYEDNDAAANAIYKKEADFMIIDTYVAASLFQNPRYSNITIYDAYKEDGSAKLAVLEEDDEILMNIINKCVAGLENRYVAEKLTMYTVGQRYSLSVSDFIYKYQNQFIILACSLAVIIFILITASVYRENVRAKIEETNSKLQVAVRQANEASQAKSDFLSKMSHEIRTPMNAIILCAQMVEDMNVKDENIRQNMQRIDYSAKYLLGIVNDILDMSKIENGKIILKEEHQNLKKIIDEIAVIIENSIHEKNIEYEVNIYDDIDKEYIFDAVKLKQILINILNNAIKFTNENGKIIFSIKQIKNNLDRNDKTTTLNFNIRDNGIGMKEEFIPHMFESFAQENDGVTSKYTGSGLGLAITHNYVKVMGGEIEVESSYGIGTEFNITIPLKNCDEKSVLEEAKKEDIDYSKFVNKKILLAEDNEINIELAVMLLESKNMIVTVAKNGEEAVNEYLNHEEYYFDAILMDIRMPVMDGLTATRVIRRSERADSETIPVIAMTANVFDDDVRNSKAAGLSEHLSKPVVPKIFFETLAKYIK